MKKQVIDNLHLVDSLSEITYYVRDANEQVLAIYRQTAHNVSGSSWCTAPPNNGGGGNDNDEDGVYNAPTPPACDNCLDKLNDQKEIAVLAVADVNQAVQMGIVPEKFRNNQNITDIINFVLTGQLNPTMNAEMLEVGIRILKEVSHKYNPPPIPNPSEQQKDNTRVFINPNLAPKENR